MTGVTYHTKVGEKIGQISPPYILLNQNVGCIFPSKIVVLSNLKQNGIRELGIGMNVFT